MTNQQKKSKLFSISLWTAQVILAFIFLTGGIMKLFWSVDKLSAMWSWAGQVPVLLVKFTGVVDLLGAVGLLFPALLRIKPIFTPIAAVCILVLMICAGTFHIVRGEASDIGINIFSAIIAVFIAWGRFIKEPIVSK